MDQSIDADQLLNNAKELFKAGVDKSRKGDFKEALKDFDRALQIEPNNADAYGNRCVARYKLGDKQGAIKDCQKASALYRVQENTKYYQYALKVLEKLQR